MHARGASEPRQGISRFTASKGNSKFEVLLVRLFSAKKKNKIKKKIANTSGFYKSKFVSSKNSLMFLETISSSFA